jgi:hypothetical protein
MIKKFSNLCASVEVLDLLLDAFIFHHERVNVSDSIPPHHHKLIGGLNCRGERRVTRKTNTFEVLTRCLAQLRRCQVCVTTL